MALFGRTVMVCRRAVDLFTDYLEDALPARDRARFDAHMQSCRDCSEYLSQLQTTIGALGHVRMETITPEARDELPALYQRWIDART